MKTGQGYPVMHMLWIGMLFVAGTAVAGQVYNDWAIVDKGSTIVKTTMLKTDELIFENRTYRYVEVPDEFAGAKITRGRVDFKDRNITIFTGFTRSVRLYFSTHPRHLDSKPNIPVEIRVTGNDGRVGVYTMKDLLNSRKRITYLLQGSNGLVKAQDLLFFLDIKDAKEIQVDAGTIPGNVFFVAE